MIQNSLLNFCNLKKKKKRIDRTVGRSIVAFALNFIVSSRWARDKREGGKKYKGKLEREREAIA